jgi:phenylacetate-CoA ligase
MPISVSEVIKHDPMFFTRYPNSIPSAFKLEWILAIETSPHSFWQPWQMQQLNNLIQFAVQRSPFWAKRISMAQHNGSTDWRAIPVLARSELSHQVFEEGSLFKEFENISNRIHQTSGSTGKPASFFVTGWNAEYNQLRSLATYYLEKRPFNFNRTQLNLETARSFNFIKSEKHTSWSPFTETGISRAIEYRPVSGNRDDRVLKKLKREIETAEIGYLIANPWIIECLFNNYGIDFFKRNGAQMWIPTVWTPDHHLSDPFIDAGIPVRAIYSSEEVGVIGTECHHVRGNYHVSVSNVFVEIDSSEPVYVNNKTLGKVLITHFHSFASPIIKYDVGDIACIDETCPCGHKGPTLSNIYGRKKNVFVLPDGSKRIFAVFLMDHQWLTKYKEFRFRQTKADTIIMEVATDDSFSDEQNVKDLIFKLAGCHMNIEIVKVKEIDWGSDSKRNIFISSLV